MTMSLILIIVAVVVVGLILLMLITLTNKGPSNNLNKEEYQAKWLEIMHTVSNSPLSWQVAIMEADKLLDHALKQRHFAGDAMGDRMKSAKNIFSDNDIVWKSHKLRNRLAHEQNVQLSQKTTAKALTGYKKALRDLGAL